MEFDEGGKAIIFKKKRPLKEDQFALEIAGETCAKPEKKRKIVYAADGKSCWWEEVDEKG